MHDNSKLYGPTSVDKNSGRKHKTNRNETKCKDSKIASVIYYHQQIFSSILEVSLKGRKRLFTHYVFNSG